MKTLVFPKDAIKIHEVGNEFHIDFFALTHKDQEQFFGILNIEPLVSPLSEFSNDAILKEVKERFDISDLVDVETEVDWNWSMRKL